MQKIRNFLSKVCIQCTTKSTYFVEYTAVRAKSGTCIPVLPCTLYRQLFTSIFECQGLRFGPATYMFWYFMFLLSNDRDSLLDTCSQIQWTTALKYGCWRPITTVYSSYLESFFSDLNIVFRHNHIFPPVWTTIEHDSGRAPGRWGATYWRQVTVTSSGPKLTGTAFR